MFRPHFHDFERHSNPFERRSRMFKKGDMKYVILDLVKDKPSHGYDITLAMEERFHGLYSPSAGSVYPILQLLEDMGHVTSNVMEGKKVYTITDSGRKFLEDQKEITENIKGRMRDWWDSENREHMEGVRTAMNYLHELKYLIGNLTTRNDHTRIAKINEILAKTVKEIEQTYNEK